MPGRCKMQEAFVMITNGFLIMRPNYTISKWRNDEQQTNGFPFTLALDEQDKKG